VPRRPSCPLKLVPLIAGGSLLEQVEEEDQVELDNPSSPGRWWMGYSVYSIHYSRYFMGLAPFPFPIHVPTQLQYLAVGIKHY